MTIQEIMLRTNNLDYIHFQDDRFQAKQSLKKAAKHHKDIDLSNSERMDIINQFAYSNDALNSFEIAISKLMYRAASEVKKGGHSERLSLAYEALILGQHRKAYEILDVAEITRDAENGVIAGDDSAVQSSIKQLLLKASVMQLMREYNGVTSEEICSVYENAITFEELIGGGFGSIPQYFSYLFKTEPQNVFVYGPALINQAEVIGDPLTVASVRHLLGEAYYEMGQYEQAEEELNAAFRCWVQLPVDEILSMAMRARVTFDLGLQYHMRGIAFYDKADLAYSEARALYKRLSELQQDYLPDLAAVYVNQSALHYQDPEKTVEESTFAIDILRKINKRGKYIEGLGHAYHNRMISKHKLGNDVEATTDYQHVHDFYAALSYVESKKSLEFQRHLEKNRKLKLHLVIGFFNTSPDSLSQLNAHIYSGLYDVRIDHDMVSEHLKKIRL